MDGKERLSVLQSESVAVPTLGKKARARDENNPALFPPASYKGGCVLVPYPQNADGFKAPAIYFLPFF